MFLDKDVLLFIESGSSNPRFLRLLWSILTIALLPLLSFGLIPVVHKIDLGYVLFFIDWVPADIVTGIVDFIHCPAGTNRAFAHGVHVVDEVRLLLQCMFVDLASGKLALIAGHHRLVAAHSRLVPQANDLAHAIAAKWLNVIKWIVVGPITLKVDVESGVHTLIRRNHRTFVNVEPLVHIWTHSDPVDAAQGHQEILGVDFFHWARILEELAVARRFIQANFQGVIFRSEQMSILNQCSNRALLSIWVGLIIRLSLIFNANFLAHWVLAANRLLFAKKLFLLFLLLREPVGLHWPTEASRVHNLGL
jgi:hypothetical protein